ncbi:MAG: hypothetical protein IJ261_05475, partial [Clostridia bacterium]|nr:hypothetical protein [Clostridia bacterium]
MRKYIKRMFTIAVCFALCGVFCVFSSALSTNEYGLGLTTSSQESGTTSTVTLNLTNSNSFDLSGIKITHSIPEGLELKSEIKDKDSEGCILSVGNLATGNTYKSELIFAVTDTPVIAGDFSSPEKSNTMLTVAAILAAAAVIAIIILLARKHKKTAAMLLALTLLIPVAGIFGVHAIGSDELRSFTLEDCVTIGGKEYPLSIKVSYTASTAKNSYFEFETDSGSSYEENATVTRPTADFSGTAVANSTVTAVTYEVRSDIDSFEVGSSGTALLNGCEWSIDNLALKAGENKVTFTATL